MVKVNYNIQYTMTLRSGEVALGEANITASEPITTDKHRDALVEALKAENDAFAVTVISCEPA